MKKTGEKITTLFRKLANPEQVNITDHIKLGANIFERKYEETDKLLTKNERIRKSYLLSEQEIEKLLPTQEMEENPQENIIQDYARKAAELRQGMRWKAREFMDDESLREIQKTDKDRYNNEDGPSIDFLINKYKELIDQKITDKNSRKLEINISELLAALSIYHSSTRSNPNINKKLKIELNSDGTIKENEPEYNQEDKKKLSKIGLLVTKGGLLRYAS